MLKIYLTFFYYYFMRRHFIFMLLVLLLINFGIGENLKLNSELKNGIEINFGGDLSSSYSNVTSIKPELPNIGEYVEKNLTSFGSDGTEEYTGEMVIDEIDEKFYMLNITLVNVAIGDDDKDGLGQGAGDIFVEGYANGNYTRYPESGEEFQLNSNENVDVSIQLVDSIAYNYEIIFEVRDADTLDEDDSLGFVEYNAISMKNQSFSLETDTSEAILTFEVSLYNLTEITAKQILDGNRPYLYVEDETSKTELPNDLVGRVIIGEDNGINAMVLQYFFYWNNEYSPDGGLYSFNLHKNDFEAFYVYYDLNNFSEPYRYVFNNYIYSNIPGFPNENLLILEKGANETENEYVNTINEDLQLLLGVNTKQIVKMLPMSEIKDWEYDSLLNRRKDVSISTLMGAKSVELTIDTSYHTFDLGPGGNEYGFNYNKTSALNDSRIKSWYSIIEDTFDNGTKNWSYFGIDVPEVGPFTFDVTQVFSVPFVLTGYKTVSQDTTAIERAKNSFLNVSQSLEIFINYNFPSTLDVTYENYVSPGTKSIAKFEYITSEKLEISIDFEYELRANLSFWLVQTSFNQSFLGSFDFDVDTGLISSVAEKLGLDSFELDDQELGSYVDLTNLRFYPQLFGEILEGSLELDLWNVIENMIGIFYPGASVILNVIDFFIDKFVLSLDFSVSGVVSVPISTSDSNIMLNTTELVFDPDNLIQYVELSIGDNIEEDFVFIIGDISYGLNFKIEWVLRCGLESPINNFVSGFDWVIGVYPSLTENLIETEGESFPVSISTETRDTPTNLDTSNSWSGIIFTIIVVGVASAIIDRIRNRIKGKK